MSSETRMILFIFLVIAYGSRAEEIREETPLHPSGGDAAQAETTVRTASTFENQNGDRYTKNSNAESRVVGSPPIFHSGFRASNYPPSPITTPRNPSSSFVHATGSPPRRNAETGNSQYFASPSNYRLSTGKKVNTRGTNFSPFTEIPNFTKFKNNAKITSGHYGKPEVSPKRPDAPSVYRLVKNFESEPVFLAKNYHDRPDFGKNRQFRVTPKDGAGYGGATIPETEPDRYGPRIVPIRAPGSSSRIPQYQAASVGQNPIGNDYEKLANQPQLHFTTNSPAQAGTNGLPIYHSNPYDRIRNDVELISQKVTTTPRPYDISEFDRFFKTTQPSFSPEASAAPQKFQNLQLPSSNLFDTYDRIFGKYSSKLGSQEAPKVDSRINVTPRYVAPKIVPEVRPVEYRSAESEDENDESRSEDRGDESASAEYRVSPTEEKNSNESYEDDETRRHERQGSYEDDDNDRNAKSDEDDDDKSRSSDSYEEKRDSSNEDDPSSSYYKNYSPDFEKEFEDSYNQEIPKEEFPHVKEVPEVEEDPSESKSSPRREKSSTGTSWTSKGHRRSKHPSRSRSEKNRGRYETRNSDEDNEGYGTSQESTRLVDAKPKDSQGRKSSRDRGSKKFRAPENSSAEKKVSAGTTKGRINGKPLRSDKFSSFRSERAPPRRDEKPETKNFRNSPKRPKSTTIDDNSRSTTLDPTSSTYLTSESPVTTSSPRPSIQELQSFTFPPFDGRRPAKKIPQDDATKTRDYHKIPSPGEFYGQPRNPTYLTDGQILRDLTGI